GGTVCPARSCSGVSGAGTGRRPTRHGDRHPFAGLGAAHQVAGVLSHFSQPDLTHVANVARVLHGRRGPSVRLDDLYGRRMYEVMAARTRIEREFDPDAVRRLKATAER